MKHLPLVAAMTLAIAAFAKIQKLGMVCQAKLGLSENGPSKKYRFYTVYIKCVYFVLGLPKFYRTQIKGLIKEVTHSTMR